MRDDGEWFVLFLSTPSVRRATLAALPTLAICCISIHALREEGDIFAPLLRWPQ